MEYLWAVLLVLVSIVCWLLNLIGLPGNWLAVGLCALYAGFGPSDEPLDIGWGVVAALVVIGLIGELLELVAGALGAKQAGGSKRGAVLALIGSISGGILGLVIGTPIPVVGSLVAAVVGACLGALAGAVLGERWKGRNMDDSLRIGQAAMWGRLLGTLGKTLVGGVMIVLILAAVIL